MTFHTDDFRGFAQDSIILRNETGGYDLYDTIKSSLISELKNRGIPAVLLDKEVKSGSRIFGTKYPMLVIVHPDSSCRYFAIGICVNKNQLTFPLLGESAENTKANKHATLENNGSFFRAALKKPDLFKLQQEEIWRKQILDCINYFIIK